MADFSKYILNENRTREISQLRDVKMIESREDVATILAIYNELEKKGVESSRIQGIKTDGRDYYIILSNRKSFISFDIVSFIDSKYSSRKVTNANILLLFPPTLSRVGGRRGTSRGDIRDGVPKLLYKSKGLLINVPRDGDVILGRSKKRTNFCIEDNNDVSRVHCKVYYDKEEGCLKVDDLDSQNGTFINGSKMRKGELGASLLVGDTLSLAGVKFLISK